LLDERCWLSPEWSAVLDFALGLELEATADGRIAAALWDLVAAGADGLGWFTTVLAGAGIRGVSTLPTSMSEVADALWKLHAAGFVSATSLAELLATTDLVDPSDVVSVVLAARRDISDQAVWEALAWCGEQGRIMLASSISAVSEAHGAAAALYQVDPPAAVAALRRRLRKSLPVSPADAIVLAALDEPDVESILQRYNQQPGFKPLACLLGWTRREVGRKALRAGLQAADARIRLGAASGLAASYGNDIDRDNFDALAALARSDPDENIRLRIRSKLNVVGMSVPWVEAALAHIVGDLYRPADTHALDTRDSSKSWGGV